MKYISPIKASKAKGLVDQVYSQVKQDFGQIVEPFTLHSPLPKLLAGVWMTSRESELVGIVPREEKEAIAACISQLNRCPYCIDAHTIMLRATGNKKAAKQITKQNYQNIQNKNIQKIIKWALSTLNPNSPLIQNPPFSTNQAPEIIGTALFYHYINPLVTIFLGKTPLPLPFLKNQMKQIATQLFKKAVKKQKKSGLSLSLLPIPKLPKEYLWAKASANISEAYSKFTNQIKEIEKKYIISQTKETISNYIKNWNPQTLPSNLEWIEINTKTLHPKIKASTSLALLTIEAPHKITKNNINSFQKYYPDQRQLLAIIAWASFTKAIKIGSWLKNNFKYKKNSKII
jgi:AhpD family alkylhydroperoxidase